MGIIDLWDVEGRYHLGGIYAHRERVSSIKFSPDGSWLVSASHDDTIKLWQHPQDWFVDWWALGPEHPSMAISFNTSVAYSFNNQAWRYYNQGRYAEAEEYLQEALALLEKDLGPEHLNVAKVLENYVALLRKMNRDAEAEELEARAKAIRAKHGQEKQPN